MAWRQGNGKLRKDQTDLYGRVKESGQISVEDFEESDDIKFSQDASTNKIKAELQEEVKEIIDSALTSDNFDSSEEIIMDIADNVISFLLEENIKDKIDASLTEEDFASSEDITISKVTNKLTATLSSAIKTILNSALSSSNFASSEEIVMSISSGIIKFYLDNTLSNKITNSLQLPLTTPTAEELVGIDTSKAQTRIAIGEGLAIIDGELVNTNTGSNWDLIWSNNNPSINFDPQDITVPSDAVFILIKVKRTTSDSTISWVICKTINEDSSCVSLQNIGTYAWAGLLRGFKRTSTTKLTIDRGYRLEGNAATTHNEYWIPLEIYVTNSDISNVISVTTSRLLEEKYKQLEDKYNVLQAQYINILSELKKGA